MCTGTQNFSYLFRQFYQRKRFLNKTLTTAIEDLSGFASHTVSTGKQHLDVGIGRFGELGNLDIDTELIDLRTLKPLDMALVAESIKKTHRAVIVHEACLTGGFGAELTARIQDELFDYLDAPIKRVAAKDYPIPFSPSLEDHVLPKVSDVIDAVRAVTYR